MPILEFALFAVPPAVVAWRYFRNDGPEQSRPPHVDPVAMPDGEALQAAACNCAAAFEGTDQEIARCVWTAIYEAVPYPPQEGDHATLAEAAELVLEAVDAARDGVCATGGGIILDPWIEDEPWPGNFYQVQTGDSLLGDNGIVARALFKAAFEASIERGDDIQTANARASGVAADPQNRIAYLHEIQCAVWNDALYGTHGYGPQAWPGPHNRAIRLLGNVGANYDRISDGLAPIRATMIGSASTPGDGSGKNTGGGARELLWLPDLSRQALTDPKRDLQVSTVGLTWPDGSPRTLPPPEVQKLGVNQLPTDIKWGCAA